MTIVVSCPRGWAGSPWEPHLLVQLLLLDISGYVLEVSPQLKPSIKKFISEWELLQDDVGPFFLPEGWSILKITQKSAGVRPGWTTKTRGGLEKKRKWGTLGASGGATELH